LNNKILEIVDLSVCFDTEDGRVNAVNNITYGIEQGEILGIVGESGSGKSVHALSIVQLIPSPPGKILKGEVWFEGRDLLAMQSKEIRRVRGKEIAIIFQDPISSLNPVYTIGYQIKESLRWNLGVTGRNAEKRAEDLLDRVGIAGPKQSLKRYPHELSGGMRQRVMIAMSLACNPKIIIADEPTTALDVTIQAQIVELIKDLQQEFKLTVIWISHDLGVIAGLAQTVNVMYAGSIVERGAVNDIYKTPYHPYTKGLLASMPRLDQITEKKLTSIPGKPPNLARLGAGCPFLPRCTYSKEICSVDMPPLNTIGDSEHLVRCWNWEEVRLKE
jgi:oligopeptide/dipeptide ABC transporter ATP-binding protein